MNLARLTASISVALALGFSLAAEDNPRPNIDISTGTAGSDGQNKKQRAISSDLSKALSAGVKYNPPPPPKPEEEDVDLREVDKPRNQIIRLPKYVVEAKRPPIFNDRNLYSKEMLRRLAYKRFTSSFSQDFLNKYHLLGKGDEAYAMMQYEAAEREQNMKDMQDRVAMYRLTGDNAEAKSLNDDTQRTFMRRTDYSTTPAPFANGQGSQ